MQSCKYVSARNVVQTETSEKSAIKTASRKLKRPRNPRQIVQTEASEKLGWMAASAQACGLSFVCNLVYYPATLRQCATSRDHFGEVVGRMGLCGCVLSVIVLFCYRTTHGSGALRKHIPVPVRPWDSLPP